MSSEYLNKEHLRKQVNEFKKKFSQDLLKRKSASIFNQLENELVFIISENIMLYWSVEGEVFTHEFIIKWNNTKNIYLPAIEGTEIVPKKFDGTNVLKSGNKHHIPEPVGEKLQNLATIDLVIVPGVAFDRVNHRIGRGKGYYDRFLSKTRAYKIGVCFDFQYYDSIPFSQNDILMDKIIYDN